MWPVFYPHVVNTDAIINIYCDRVGNHVLVMYIEIIEIRGENIYLFWYTSAFGVNKNISYPNSIDRFHIHYEMICINQANSKVLGNLRF